jgi:hypothetical protein
VGLALLIPLVLIGGTGIMLNHERSLGLKKTYKPQSKPHGSELVPSKAVAPDLTAFVASQNAVKDHGSSIEAALAAAKATWGPVALERVELKHEPDMGLVVKVKAAKSANVAPEEVVWSLSQAALLTREEDEPGAWNWQKIVHDLHTGKIFSEHYGFWWSDLTGLSIVLLTGTGLVLYLIPVFKKSAKRRAKGKAVASQPRGPQALVRARTPELRPKVATPEPAAEELVEVPV